MKISKKTAILKYLVTTTAEIVQGAEYPCKRVLGNGRVNVEGRSDKHCTPIAIYLTVESSTSQWAPWSPRFVLWPGECLRSKDRVLVRAEIETTMFHSNILYTHCGRY